MTSGIPLVDLETAKELLRMVSPQWTEFLESLEDSGGRLAFCPEFVATISNLKLGAYPRLYEHEAASGNLLARAFYGAELEAFDNQLRLASPEGRGAMLKELGVELDRVGDAVNFAPTPADKARADDALNSLTAEEQTEAVQFFQHLLASTLAIFYGQLSVMVHGERLTKLVARAKTGDDEAFLKAVQIDKGVLTEVPYFADRFMRAQRLGEQSFITAVSRKLEAAPYVGKISHKKLWLAFAFLDDLGLLDKLDGNGLLDLLQEAGVIDDEKPVDDVKNLLKLKARYREFQSRGDMSTP